MESLQRRGGVAHANTTRPTDQRPLFAIAANTALALRFGAGAKMLVPQLSPAIVDGIPEAFTLGGELIRWHQGGLLLVAGDAAPRLLRAEVLEDGSGVASPAVVDGARNVDGSNRYLRRTIDDPRLIQGFVERWLAASEDSIDVRWLTQAAGALGTFVTSSLFNPTADEPVAIAGDGPGPRIVPPHPTHGATRSEKAERARPRQLMSAEELHGPAPCSPVCARYLVRQPVVGMQRCTDE